jgi:hypothetical protein
VVLVTAIAALIGVVALTIPNTRAALASLGAHSRGAVALSDPPPAPSKGPAVAQVVAQPPPPAPTLRAPADPAAVHAPGGASFFGWAFLDRRTGAITGSANSATGTNSTESMVKAWIAADYLRRQAESGRTPDSNALNEITLMIIDSNDNMAEKYYELDGTNAVIQRLISMCRLAHTTIYPYWWAKTQMPPQDAVRYGNCLGSGTAAGPKWTDWLLETMRHVRGGVNDQISVTRQGGHWGIIDGLPPELVATTSIKNGWTAYKDGWHVNCLAVQRDWVLNVMVRIGGLQPAANACKAVAQQLVVIPDR